MNIVGYRISTLHDSPERRQESIAEACAELAEVLDVPLAEVSVQTVRHETYEDINAVWVPAWRIP